MKQKIYRNSTTGIVFPVCNEHAKHYVRENILETIYNGMKCKDCQNGFYKRKIDSACKLSLNQRLSLPADMFAAVDNELTRRKHAKAGE